MRDVDSCANLSVCGKNIMFQIRKEYEPDLIGGGGV